MKRKTITMFVMILLFCSLVFAQEDDWEWDYLSEDSYYLYDFYETSDITKWNYELVDWELVDFTREDLYEDERFYHYLPEDMYDELNYKKVDYNLIDHDKVDAEKFFDDMGCTGCSLDRGGQSMTFTYGDIRHPAGDFAKLQEYPSGTLFVAYEDRLEAVLPNDITEFEMPLIDWITIDTGDREIIIDYLRTDDFKIKGKISKGSKGIFIKAGDSATIYGVEITAHYNNVDIFSDANEGIYSEEYFNELENVVSFREDSILIRGDHFDAEFMQGNEYVDFEYGDRFIVRPLNGGNVEIFNHDDEGFAPEVIVTGPEDEEGWARIRNGRSDFTVGSTGLVSLDVNEAFSSKYGSVPMEVKVLDEQGNSLINEEDSTREGKIVINNDNEMSIDSMDAVVDINGEISCTPEKTPTGDVVAITGLGVFGRLASEIPCTLGFVKYSNRQRYDLINDIQEKFGEGSEYDIEFVDIDLWTQGQLYQALQSFEKLEEFNPELVGAIRSIEIESIEIDGFTASLGYYDPAEKSITLTKNILFPRGLSFRVLAHEAAHAYHASIDGREEFEEQWYTITGNGDPEIGRLAYREEYGFELEDSNRNEYSLRTGGWVRDYGSTDIREDVATMVDKTARTGSIAEMQDNEKILAKVILLCEYGFLADYSDACMQTAYGVRPHSQRLH